jgi:hypothetical protein
LALPVNESRDKHGGEGGDKPFHAGNETRGAAVGEGFPWGIVRVAK